MSERRFRRFRRVSACFRRVRYEFKSGTLTSARGRRQFETLQKERLMETLGCGWARLQDCACATSISFEADSLCRTRWSGSTATCRSRARGLRGAFDPFPGRSQRYRRCAECGRRGSRLRSTTGTGFDTALRAYSTSEVADMAAIIAFAGRLPNRECDGHRPCGLRPKSRIARFLAEPPVGFEPTTPALQERCSGQLS